MPQVSRIIFEIVKWSTYFKFLKIVLIVQNWEVPVVHFWDPPLPLKIRQNSLYGLSLPTFEEGTVLSRKDPTNCQKIEICQTIKYLKNCQML